MIDLWLPRNKSSKKHSIFHGHFLCFFMLDVQTSHRLLVKHLSFVPIVSIIMLFHQELLINSEDLQENHWCQGYRLLIVGPGTGFRKVNCCYISFLSCLELVLKPRMVIFFLMVFILAVKSGTRPEKWWKDRKYDTALTQLQNSCRAETLKRL